MAVRRESVVLSLDDQFTTGMARAAAATGLLKRALDDLDGTNLNVGDGLDETARGTERLGASSSRSGPEIDKLSGRLRVFRDLALTVGPAVVPLGAAVLPALTGSIAALGAASGGIGAAVLAFNGLGDAMKAIDAAQLKPTAQNLEAMRIQLEQLGPAGADFARYLQDIEPQFRELQMTARAGMFPGVEDGIGDLLTRLPQVQEIIDRLSRGMGDLAAEAGDSIASEAWSPFFDYVETTARPTLVRFGESVGNVSLGLANMLVAFAPLSRDFSRGILEMSESFAEWSTNLDSNESFQSFLDYIRESGPQAMDLLGSLAELFVAVVKAAAPIGSVVLPILTATADVLTAVASTDAGTALIAAAAGLTAFGRASAFVSPRIATLPKTLSQTAMVAASINWGQVAGGIGLLAASATDLDDKMGLSNTAMLTSAGLLAGPWGAAIGAAAGLTLDVADAHRDLTDAVGQADRALESGSLSERIQELKDVRAAIEDQNDAASHSINPIRMAAAAWNYVTGAEGDAKDKALELEVAIRATRGAAAVAALQVGRLGGDLRDAAGNATTFSRALEELNGWLDKREALRNYQDAFHDLSQGLKNGFTREDAEDIDAVGRSISQVIASIKSPEMKAQFAAEFRAGLVDLARNAGPKASAAIQNLINKLDEYGATQPPPKKLTGDDRDLRAKVKGATGLIDALVSGKNMVVITADGKSVVLTVAQANRLLNGIDGKTATTTIRTVHEDVFTGMGPQPASGSAMGGTVPKSGRGYADRYHYLLADGEEVISNRYGQADRHRDLLKAINAGRLAGGGTTGGWATASAASPFGGAVPQSMEVLSHAIESLTSAMEKQKSKVDEVNSAMESVASSVASKFDVNFSAGSTFSVQDLMGQGLDFGAASSIAAGSQQANLSNSIGAAEADLASYNQVLATLKGWGIKGPALVDLVTKMSVSQLQGLVAGGASFVQAQIGRLDALGAGARQAGALTAQAGFGDELKAQTREFREMKKELQELRKEQKQHSDREVNATQNVGPDVARVLNNAGRAARHRGASGG